MTSWYTRSPSSLAPFQYSAHPRRYPPSPPLRLRVTEGLVAFDQKQIKRCSGAYPHERESGADPVG